MSVNKSLFFLLFIVSSVSVYFLSDNIKKIQTNQYQETIYTQVQNQMLKDFEIAYLNNKLEPISDRNNSIDIFKVGIQLDEIVEKIEDKKLKVIIALNKKDSKNINLNLSHSRTFINNKYIVNKNFNKFYMKILEQSEIYDNDNILKYVSKNNGIVFVKKFILSINNNNAMYVYILKSVDDIDLAFSDTLIDLINIITALLILVIGLIIYNISGRRSNIDYFNQNKVLLKENKKLKLLSDQLDFNEKKLSNIFNLQPNIMFVSNGINIVQVNKRFMGFFRRYKTIENFRKHHHSVSELFEEYDSTNYISSGLIEGKNWLEYILEHPKRVYKTIMSVDGEKHHFIIKVNEMKYAKKFKERYIIVAFIDITQDLNSKKITNDFVVHSAKDLDLSYLIGNITAYILCEYTHILPTKQAIFKANKDDIDRSNLLKIETNLISDDKNLSWQFIFPSQTVSYIFNMIIREYDVEIVDVVDEDIIETAYELVNSIMAVLVADIKNLKYQEFNNLIYKIDDAVLVDKNEIDQDNLYKCIMYIDNHEIAIMINFDQDSLQYINIS